ncbi:hypothetical protein D3C87_1160500 [compost metagenome]
MLTKATPPEIRALYDQAMDIYATTSIARVFASEVTMVIDQKPNAETDRHDIWFYRFGKSHERFAQITSGGEYMILDSGLVENIVLNAMKGLPTVFKEARNTLSLIETGLPWAIATGEQPPPAQRIGRRAPSPRRS